MHEKLGDKWMENGMDYEAKFLRETHILENKVCRALICICVDNSFSMSGSRISAVNKSIGDFLKQMDENRFARDAVEICVVSFGHEVNVLCEFGPIGDAISANKRIVADGSRTEMGEGIEKALELLDIEISNLMSTGNRFYKPWLIIISDGEATDKTRCARLSKEVLRRQREGKLKVKCMSMDDSSEILTLKSFSIDGEVKVIDEITTNTFFSQLSRSISSVSQGRIQASEF